MNQHKFTIFVLTVFVFTACRKDVPKGTLIQASGIVFDSVKNKKLANIKVYLYGAHTSFYGITYTEGPFDSAMTDNNGNFSLEYYAEGNHVDYGLGVGNIGQARQNNCVIDIYNPIYPFNYLHKLDNVVLSARELNYARLNLKVLSNPYDTLYLDIETSYGELYLRNVFIGKIIDTSFLTRYLPKDSNFFMYNILSTSLDDSGFRREQIDTLSSQFKDTIIISKTINTTYNLLLKH